MNDLVALLQEFHGDKLADLLRHQAAARMIRQYDFNNTYQYIINREEVQLTWIAMAIVESGGSVREEPAEPPRSVSSKDPEGWRTIVEEDARAEQAFVGRWRPRVEGMTNARHRGMLRVVLGETLEQKRFFEQMLAGERDLLGRRTDPVGPRVGEVLPTRWIE